jgi:hypothetical protein
MFAEARRPGAESKVRPPAALSSRGLKVVPAAQGRKGLVLHQTLRQFEQADDGYDAEQNQQDDVHWPQNETAARATRDATRTQKSRAVRTSGHRQPPFIEAAPRCHEYASVFKLF